MSHPEPAAGARTDLNRQSGDAKGADGAAESSVLLEWSQGEEFAREGEVAAVTPPDTALYAIGDVHGCRDLLEAMQEGVARDLRSRAARRKVIIYLGDYLSRGGESRQALERVRSWRPTGAPEVEIVPLKGNHEDMALLFLGGDLELGRHWLCSGGFEALASYGIEHPPVGLEELELQTAEELRRRFAEAIPREHLEFLQGLKSCHREGGYHFVHAGVRPGVPLSRQNDKDQMWIKYRFLRSDADHGATVVHAHAIVERPQLHPNRIAIDTGAYQSGRLTCLILQGGSRLFLQTRRAALAGTPLTPSGVSPQR